MAKMQREERRERERERQQINNYIFHIFHTNFDFIYINSFICFLFLFFSDMITNKDIYSRIQPKTSDGNNTLRDNDDGDNNHHNNELTHQAIAITGPSSFLRGEFSVVPTMPKKKPTGAYYSSPFNARQRVVHPAKTSSRAASNNNNNNNNNNSSNNNSSTNYNNNSINSDDSNNDYHSPPITKFSPRGPIAETYSSGKQPQFVRSLNDSFEESGG